MCVLIISIIFSFFGFKSTVEFNKTAFNNDEVLICFNTLIVSNSNWKLSGDNLINNNSAGYIKIKDCKVKHEE